MSDRVGFDLLCHNHAFEFREVGGTTAFRRLAERTDEAVGFESDIGLATKAGRDPVSLLCEYGDRIPAVHVTDTFVDSPERDLVELGEGDVALARCVEAARDAGVEWFVFEHGQSTDQLGSL
ncbi:sugar phosphate isomerase/epimerase family protein [Halegenticoccus soli]|uniref:sugar phosphate isomerase/epimerase family protein n=1 Tax=Halegenticoccus soli TaxID=1985678 RepID=UPI00130441B3|nr:TIM barrel protein [Halegenticoccus soli]